MCLAPKPRRSLSKPGATPQELCCAEGAVSLLAWGNAPGLVKSEPAALKARFTKDYLTHQRSFGKWINHPSPQSSPRKRGEAQYGTQCLRLQLLKRDAL